jgi:hypothetical protein
LPNTSSQTDDGYDRTAPGLKPDQRTLHPDALAAVEQLGGSQMLASGLINLIALDPIAERLGPKWAERREAVYDYAERVLERQIGETGQFLRVSEFDFLVVLPNEGCFSAQLRCIRCTREVLTHFLGSAQPSDIAVRRVGAIGRYGVEGVLVDPAVVAVEAKAEAEREETLARRSAGPKGPFDKWTPFVASNGLKVRVSCVLEPVFEVKGYTRIGNRIARRVLRTDTEEELSAIELANLSRGDMERIDLATIARGLDRLRNDTEGNQLSLIVPVSHISLSHAQGRAALAALFREAKQYVRTGVICEVADIDDVPQRTLLEATSLIKPFCLFVIGRLTNAPTRKLSNLYNTGLQAVSFEAPKAVMADGEFLSWARDAISAAKLIAKSVMIYRVGSPRQAAMASLVGATHVSLRN